MAKVSVIMGVYNAQSEMNFHHSINSILAQTLTDFEFIICDDGSTDESYNMLKRIENADKRIVLLKNDKNCGLAKSLNKCIAKAKSDILIRQDIDDLSQNNRIELLVYELEANPELAFIGSNCKLINQGGIWGEMRYPQFPKSKDFLFGLPFLHGAVAMRKSAVMAVGGYNTKKFAHRTEDYELFMRLYKNGFYGKNIQKPLYHYKEDEKAAKRRKYRFRINEAIVRARGFYGLGLFPVGILFVIKPLIVGLIPKMLLEKLKDKYYNRRITR